MKLLTASVESRHKVPELRDLINKTQPKVICLTQAYNLTDWAKTFSGYKLKQFSVPSEASAVALLLHHDVKVLDIRTMAMQRSWIGPKQGNEHQPRVYPVLKLTYRGKTFRLIGVHAPTANNKLAQAETWNRLELYRKNHPKARVLLIGDFNATAETLEVALPPYDLIIGKKVDHLLKAGKINHLKTTRHVVPEGLHGFVSFDVELIGGL